MSDLNRYQYGYDQNSNRLWKGNTVAHAAGVYLDEAYTYDNLNRLTLMQRGTPNSGKTGITGTPSREMDYTLDPTGNWSAYLTKTSGTTDLTQTRTANMVNEITAIGGTPGWATPPIYDAAGNMTSFPQPASPGSAFTATYDAWNRMTSVSSGGSTVATYQYDGRGRRIVKYTPSIAETRHFYYSNNWQDIEERVGTASTMDKQYVWGVRYIDELICRDDATPQRLYVCQDANFNLTAITDTSGNVQQRFVYDPYGTSSVLTSAWETITDAYDWAFRFTGQLFDPETQMYCYRARYYHVYTGLFLSRDPGGYSGSNSLNLFEYVRTQPTFFLDPSGLCVAPNPYAPVQPLFPPLQTDPYLPGPVTPSPVTPGPLWPDPITYPLPQTAPDPVPVEPEFPIWAVIFPIYYLLGPGASNCQAPMTDPNPPPPPPTPPVLFTSNLDDCLKAAASAEAWVIFCKTFADSRARALCFRDKSTKGTKPQERENWCYDYFSQ